MIFKDLEFKKIKLVEMKLFLRILSNKILLNNKYNVV